MLNRTNQQIIDDIIIYLSERLDKQLYNFSNILSERENLELLDTNVYFYVAGNILLLKDDGVDTSNNPKIEGVDYRESYHDERTIILRCMVAHLTHELSNKKTTSIKSLIELLETTHRTFNKEFTNILYLFVLFCEDELYQNLCSVLAKFISQIVYNDYTKYDVAKAQQLN